jgi:hypothetical protein
MEFVYSGDVKVHIVLRKHMAVLLIRLAHQTNDSMTTIVRQALARYINSYANESVPGPVEI